MRWSHFVEGTFERPVTAWTALRVARSWLAKCPQSYAAVGVQLGPINLKIHVHLLVGGVNAKGETLLRGNWVRDGHVKIERFHPSLGGVEYVVRQADQIELLGTPVLYCPRKRGRKADRSIGALG